jgi:hypothetical protein
VDAVYLHGDDDDDLANFGDDEDVGMTDEKRALLAMFESVPRDAYILQALAVEEQPLSMRQAYEILDPTAVHRVAHEKVVAARRQEHPRVDWENRELEEAVTAMSTVEAMVAREMALLLGR